MYILQTQYQCKQLKCVVIVMLHKYSVRNVLGHSCHSESESESEILFNIICVITISIK